MEGHFLWLFKIVYTKTIEQFELCQLEVLSFITGHKWIQK